MSWVDHIEGTLPADDLRRAFVMGAQWWEFQSTGATMWNSDRRLAEEKAEEYFPNGQPPNKGTNTDLTTAPSSDGGEVGRV